MPEPNKEQLAGWFHIHRDKDDDWDTWFTVRDDDGVPFALLASLAPFVGLPVRITIEHIPEMKAGGAEPPLVYKMIGMTAENAKKEADQERERWLEIARKEFT